MPPTEPMSWATIVTSQAGPGGELMGARGTVQLSLTVRTFADQIDSGGASLEEIVEGALAAAQPQAGLRWLDIGCGRGDLLRAIRDAGSRPSCTAWTRSMARRRSARRGVASSRSRPSRRELPSVDRVMLVEVIEHLEAPWTRCATPHGASRRAGAIVVSTPNLATLRTRLELAVRGNLTSFRPDNEPHISPALPHVTTRILPEEGLTVDPPTFAGADVISLTGGRVWPESLRRRFPELTSVSVVIAARR